MANRYWIGGSGHWVDTAHWSTTSGGSGGASAPASTDEVIFDANSFSAPSQVVTLDIDDAGSSDLLFINVYSIDMSNVTNSPSLYFKTISSIPDKVGVTLRVNGPVTIGP